MLKKRQTWFSLVFVAALLLQFIAVGSSQSAELKVYAFKCGILKTQTQYLLKDTRVGTPYDIPVPFFVIKHGKDWVAFDTGNNAKVAVDSTNYWGEGIVKAYTPVMKPEEAFTEQIKKLGLTPKDFKAVIISHGHLDHAGSIDSFKGTNVPIYFQKAEMDYIKKLLAEKKEGTAYILADFDLMKDLNIKEIDGIFDLFGDKTIVAFPTPGHTQGHQSLYIKPTKGKPYIYAADAMYTIENMDHMIPPGLAWEIPLTMDNISFFKLFRYVGAASIVPSHDPEYWAKKAWAPKEFKP
jgi:N-acyl homoserine lactone hydrolase